MDPVLDPTTQHLQDLSQNSDHGLLEARNQTEAIKALEMPLEGILMKADQIIQVIQALPLQMGQPTEVTNHEVIAILQSILEESKSPTNVNVTLDLQ